MVEVVDDGVTVATVRIDGDVPGLFLVDAVARLALAARRLGWRVRVADRDLGELLDLAGVRLDPGREPERREEPFVEVVVQPHDPPA